MHSLYAKITSASTPLFPDVYFVSYNNCVFIVSSVAILGYNICVCHLLSNKEISVIRCGFCTAHDDFMWDVMSIL